MQRKHFLISLGFGALLLAAQQSQAQQSQARQCADRATVVSYLTEQQGETRRAVGLSGDTAMVEVFASDDTGTWSIIVTQAGGLTCLVAAGHAYHSATDPLPDPGQGT